MIPHDPIGAPKDADDPRKKADHRSTERSLIAVAAVARPGRDRRPNNTLPFLAVAVEGHRTRWGFELRARSSSRRWRLRGWPCWRSDSDRPDRRSAAWPPRPGFAACPRRPPAGLEPNGTPILRGHHTPPCRGRGDLDQLPQGPRPLRPLRRGRILAHPRARGPLATRPARLAGPGGAGRGRDLDTLPGGVLDRVLHLPRLNTRVARTVLRPGGAATRGPGLPRCGDEMRTSRRFATRTADRPGHPGNPRADPENDSGGSYDDILSLFDKSSDREVPPTA